MDYPMPDFNAERHEYRFGERLVPSVTQILEKGGLSVTTFCTQFGMDRGRALHRAIELANAGDLDEATVDPEIVAHMGAYRRFLQLSGLQIDRSEFTVYSATQDYAGRPDIYGLLHGAPVLIDAKTNTTPKSVGPQLYAYKFAMAEMGLPVKKTLSLTLKSNGDFRLKEHKDPNDGAEWFKALNISRGLSA